MITRDQAQTLRAIQQDNLYSWPKPNGRSIAISGGKGGVGKSSIAVNLAAAFGARGGRTLLVDGDLGMADLNLLLGLAPEHNVLDLLRGLAIEDVLASAHGVHLLPGMNGNHHLANLPPEARSELIAELKVLARGFDNVVIDTAAGINPTSMGLASSASDVIVVATAEPLSLADAYAAIKVLSTQHRVERVFLVPNAVRNKSEADQVVAQLKVLVLRFLDLEVVALPHVPFDALMPASGGAGIPLVLSHPDSPASRAIKRISRLMDPGAKEAAR